MMVEILVMMYMRWVDVYNLAHPRKELEDWPSTTYSYVYKSHLLIIII